MPDRLPDPVVIDAVVPARNEADTVATVVDACRRCSAVREVIVVDDGSVDDTGDRAAAAGAKVIQRIDTATARDRGGSKAHAMEAGVAASDAPALLFVDADLRGLIACSRCLSPVSCAGGPTGSTCAASRWNADDAHAPEPASRRAMTLRARVSSAPSKIERTLASTKYRLTGNSSA